MTIIVARIFLLEDRLQDRVFRCEFDRVEGIDELVVVHLGLGGTFQAVVNKEIGEPSVFI